MDSFKYLNYYGVVYGCDFFMTLGNLIGGFIVILVGVNLMPTVANQVTAAQSGNVTGASSAILGLTIVFFALGIMSAGVSLAVVGLRNAGLV